MIEINRILCPIDFSEYSGLALRYAMKMAAWCGASLHVLHVMPPLPPAATSPLAEAGRQLTSSNLGSSVERWRQPGVAVTTELIESAEASARIMERAEALDADLVVTGSHGRTGVTRMLLGSVVEPLLHHCRQPLLVIPAGVDRSRLERPLGFPRILCAVDFSAPSVTALAYALSIAEEADATLTLLNVIELPPELRDPPQPPDFRLGQARGDLEAERRTRLQTLVPERAGDYCTVETAVLAGAASPEILRFAEERAMDLVVVGVHGRDAVDLALFGSNARDIVRRAHCPILVIPAGRRRTGVVAPSWIRHAEPALVV